jgi:hypothetical protein
VGGDYFKSSFNNFTEEVIEFRDISFTENTLCNEMDYDNDGLIGYFDNRPDTCNQNQLDADSDSIGDVCGDIPGCVGCGFSQCEPECWLECFNDSQKAGN